MLAALPGGFEVLTLAPVLPLGAHSGVAAVDPRNVIATIRGTEVAADLTNGLALEAAVRRRGSLAQAPRSAQPVWLAATQRVTRAQPVSGPVSFHVIEDPGRQSGRAYYRSACFKCSATVRSGCSSAGTASTDWRS